MTLEHGLAVQYQDYHMTPRRSVPGLPHDARAWPRPRTRESRRHGAWLRAARTPSRRAGAARCTCHAARQCKKQVDSVIVWAPLSLPATVNITLENTLGVGPMPHGRAMLNHPSGASE